MRFFDYRQQESDPIELRQLFGRMEVIKELKKRLKISILEKTGGPDQQRIVTSSSHLSPFFQTRCGSERGKAALRRDPDSGL